MLISIIYILIVISVFLITLHLSLILLFEISSFFYYFSKLFFKKYLVIKKKINCHFSSQKLIIPKFSSTFFYTSFKNFLESTIATYKFIIFIENVTFCNKKIIRFQHTRKSIIARIIEKQCSLSIYAKENYTNFYTITKIIKIEQICSEIGPLNRFIFN